MRSSAICQGAAVLFISRVPVPGFHPVRRLTDHAMCVETLDPLGFESPHVKRSIVDEPIGESFWTAQSAISFTEDRRYAYAREEVYLTTHTARDLPPTTSKWIAFLLCRKGQQQKLP